MHLLRVIEINGGHIGVNTTQLLRYIADMLEDVPILIFSCWRLCVGVKEVLSG